jgi:broad specificity phosphatase PhoE
MSGPGIPVGVQPGVGMQRSYHRRVDPERTDGARRAEIVVVRHGQSEWNAVHRWQGTADPPLTELGRTQARAQAAALAGTNWAGPWASPLHRAADTAAILADELGLGPVRLDDRLREAHAGEWEGLTPTEIESTWPGLLRDNRRPPSFEPDDEVQERAWSAIVEIADHLAVEAPERVGLVVAHSGLMRRIAEMHGHGDVGVPNLGGYRLRVVEHAPDHPRRWWVEVLERFAPVIDSRSGRSRTD